VNGPPALAVWVAISGAVTSSIVALTLPEMTPP
jgi:hypothetical protein